jgi:hypothetical protein
MFLRSICVCAGLFRISFSLTLLDLSLRSEERTFSLKYKETGESFSADAEEVFPADFSVTKMAFLSVRDSRLKDSFGILAGALPSLLSDEMSTLNFFWTSSKSLSSRI